MSAKPASSSPAAGPAKDLAEDVRRGLTAARKTLSPHLFYDAAGSRLYERITDLPEYYLTRAEHEIFEAQGQAILALATSSAGSPRPLTIVELGAGSAAKTEVLLRALVEAQGDCLYVPIDVSPAALEHAERRLRESLPTVTVRPLVMTHEQAIRAVRGTNGPALVLFIGSSVGNFTDDEASRLLRGFRESLGPESSVLLGTDLAKSLDVLLPAYDDAAGVTAAFNKNVLVRINRELGGDFDVEGFRHLARWNAEASAVEMHLESLTRQDVRIERLGLRVSFAERETIHTESSIKYTLPRVERLLAAAGFELARTFYDPRRLFAVHLAVGERAPLHKVLAE